MRVSVRSGVSVIASVSLFGLLHCSEAGDDGDGGAAKAGDPCASVYAGQCGTACSFDTQCPEGLYCSAQGQCTADCGGSVTRCGAGERCTSSGRCDPGGAAGSSSSGGNGSGGTLIIPDTEVGGEGPGPGTGGTKTCADIQLTLADQVPSVVLLIDRSDSMSQDHLDGTSNTPKRWDALKTALLADDGVLAVLQSKVRFGVMFYGNPDNGGACPNLDQTLMPPALDNFSAIKAHYSPLHTIPNTPTGESVRAAAAALAEFSEPGPKYIVLATDGFPDRCDQTNENHDDLSRELSVNEVEAAFDEHEIGTFVISVGTAISDMHLQHLANVGAGKAQDAVPGAEFFKVTTQAALATAFETVIKGVRSCTFTLNGEIHPDLADRGEVLLDGAPVDYDPVSGWRVNSPTEIELVGEACQAIAEGDHELSARFPCEVVRKPPA
jgi:hypothetical protein